MKYRLRTLPILLAVGPPLLALAWFGHETIALQAALAVFVKRCWIGSPSNMK